VFGVDRIEDSKNCKYVIRTSDDPTALCSRIHTLIGRLRKEKPHFQNLQVITRHSEGSESLDEENFFDHLIEDGIAADNKVRIAEQATVATMSYYNFLCWIHQQMQIKLNSYIL